MEFRRRLAVVAAALVAIGIAAVLLLHAPPVRRAALQYAIPLVEQQYGLRLEAARLDYNLAALRVGLAGLRLSALDAAGNEPFFSADYVSVTLARQSLLGPLAFEDISVTNARVLIRRREDGTTNLPPQSDRATSDPPPLRVNRIAAARLSVDLRDEQAARFVWIPALALLLTPDEGYLRLERPAEVHTETQVTEITQLTGGATFDGRALHLTDMQMRMAEMSTRLDGSLTLIAREPAADLRVRGTGDLTRLSRWAVMNGSLPRGDVSFDAQVTGAFADLDTRASVTSGRVSWRALAVTDLMARLHVTAAAAGVEELQFGVEGGRVTATGTVPFDENGSGRVSASWTGVSAASATLALAPDAAVVPSGAVAGRLDLHGTGVDVARWSGSLAFTVAPGQNARGRVAVAGQANVAIGEQGWSLDGRHVIGGVLPLTIALQGRQPTADGAIDGRVQVGDTDLPALIGMLQTTGVADVGEGAVTAGTLDADVRLAGSLADPAIDGRASVRRAEGSQVQVASLQALVSGRPLDPEFEFSVGAPDASIGGQRVIDVRAAGRLTGPPRSSARSGRASDTLLLLEELSARQPAGPGVLTADGAYSVRTRRYTVSVEGTEWRLTPTTDRPLAGSVDLRLSGEGTVDAPRAVGRLAVRDAMWRETRLGLLDASVALEGRTARIDAAAPEFSATATAAVQLDAPYAAVVDARAKGLDLARVLQGIETPTPIAGAATFEIHAELPLETWRSGSATMEVTALDATAGELPLRLTEPARIGYEAARVRVERLEAAAGETRISASGDLPAFDPSSDAPGIIVTVTGNVEEVVRAAAATKLTQLPVTGGNGPVALLARVTGAVQSPVVAADLEVGPGSMTLDHLPPVSGLRVRAHAEDGWLELREGAASYEKAELSVTGKAPIALLTGSPDSRRAGPVGPGAGDAVLHARATNLTPAILAPFMDPGTVEQIDGSLDGTLDAASPTLDLADLTGEFRIDRFDLRVADLPVTQRVPTRIVARDGFARVEAWDWTGQGATLALRGQMRLEDRQTAILANGVVDLRVLTPFVRSAGMSTAGRLEPRLSITGPIDNPRIDGDMVITDGEMRLVDPRVLVSDLSVRTVLTRTTARITSLTGSVNGGALTGGGGLEYSPERGVEAEISTDIRGMALEFPQGFRSEIDAQLQLAMNTGAGADLQAGSRPPAGGRLSGTVTVVRSTYREPLAVVTGLLAGVRAGRLAAATGPAASPLDRLALDLRVVTDEDVIVDNNYARVQLGGDLRVIGTAAAPALSGRAELREGGQLFVGRNVYTVNVGAIDFANPVAIEPNLNVEAATRAGGEDIDVTITGPAEAPTVTLASPSNPDLGQAELASLLLTGRRLEDLAPGDAAFVGTQVLGNFSAEVLGFASRAVGLDTLRLGGVEGTAQRRDPTAVATQIDPTTRLTFGKSIGSDLDVTFSQSLRAGDAQTWIVEYVPRRAFELRLVSDDDDLRSYGFRHDVTLGGASRPAEPGALSRRIAELRVAAVDVSGDLALPEARVRGALQLDVGDRFDFGRWQTDRDRLEELYREAGYLTARITARRSDDANGVALVYEIVAGPETRIEVAGLDLDATLRSQLETAWLQSVFDDFLIDEASQIVRSHLARSGYLQPSLDVRVRDGGRTKTLVVTVDPGPRSVQTTVRIDGASEALTSRIRDHLTARNLIENAVSDPTAVEGEVAAYLRAQGHLRARVTAGAPLFEDATASLPIRVEAGPAFTMASLTFEGDRSLPDEVLREAAALAEGSPYDPAMVEAARDRLMALHRREGFASATVAARPNVRGETPLVDVAFAIDEGVRQVLGEVVVVGTRAIDSDVIVRSLGISTGEALRAEDVLRARTRVFDTGLFRRIDVASEPMEPESGRMRLRVTVEEWPAARLRYGFVVAEERPETNIEGRELVPGLSADLTRRTLFGRPIAVGGAVELQRRERRGRTFLNAPTFLGLPLESSLIAERSREEFQAASLVTNRSRVTWEQRTRVASNLTLSYAYTFERAHTVDTDPTDTGGLAFDLTINMARLNGSAAWDTRDDPSDTTRGLLASSSLEFAPENLGSDIRFIRQLAQAYAFRPWRSAVFASAARVGVVVPLEGQELIPTERFFAGGSRTVRGVPEEGLGERDFFGSAAGGRMMVVLNQEVRVPVYKWVRGVAFVDAGNVFARPGDTSLRDLVGSIGFGLRLATPFALLRADFGKPIWGTSGPASGRWTFGIGQAF